jgi:hypothetical protein
MFVLVLCLSSHVYPGKSKRSIAQTVSNRLMTGSAGPELSCTGAMQNLSDAVHLLSHVYQP